jgi:uncharacterized protein YukE
MGKHSLPRTARFARAGGTGEATNIADEVLAKLKDAAKLEKLILTGVFISVTAVANVPAMGSAAANWRSRISGELDKAGNNLMSDIASMSGKNWIADDQKAFVSTVEKFKSELETARKYVDQIGETVDELGDTYRAYWIAIGSMIIAAIIALIVYKAMQFTPQGAVMGQLLSKALGVLVVGFIATTTAGLVSTLESAGGVFVLCADVQPETDRQLENRLQEGRHRHRPAVHLARTQAQQTGAVRQLATGPAMSDDPLGEIRLRCARAGSWRGLWREPRAVPAGLAPYRVSDDVLSLGDVEERPDALDAVHRWRPGA